ncbi:hypothetical protein ABZY03_25030 [Streptomyces klenkii]|uniref:hypothetical protein n=1 Tax=Streptomyces klenkii TaxID=1420899 RepID=UPI0033A79E7F
MHLRPLGAVTPPGWRSTASPACRAAAVAGAVDGLVRLTWGELPVQAASGAS